MRNNYLAPVLAVFLLASFSQAQIAAGGIYTLQQASVANGGGTVIDGSNRYRIDGTVGQSIASQQSTGGSYVLVSGFWSALLAPTAGDASISGRVLLENGQGIRGVVVTLMGGPLTTPRIFVTNNFGNFKFDGVEVGQAYVLSVEHKRYGFGQPTQIISLTDNVSGILFTANWLN